MLMVTISSSDSLPIELLESLILLLFSRYCCAQYGWNGVNILCSSEPSALDL